MAYEFQEDTGFGTSPVSLPQTQSQSQVTRLNEVEVPTKPTITLQEIVDNFDIVDIESTHAVVTPKYEHGQSVVLAERGGRPSFSELGTTGETAYGFMRIDDYNPAMAGYSGLRKYDQMRKSDGQVRSMLRLIKTPILAGRWYMQPASDKPKDIMISEYIWKCLSKWMSSSFPQILQESLVMLDFGYYVFEKVFAYNTDPRYRGKIIWKKFAPRHPMNIVDWDFDQYGGPKGIQYAQAANSIVGTAQVPIPMSKLLVFTYEKEAGNMTGVSLLRSAYKHFYYKENLYKVDAIQKERHGIGIPIIQLPPNYTEEDKRAANEMGRNLRTNEKSHIVVPPLWSIEFAKLEGQLTDCLPSIEHHDKMIANNVLSQFAVEGADQQDVFIKSTRYIADIIRDVFNKYAIPQLIGYNWPNVDEFPELKVRRIGETQDWRTFSFAIRNLTGAGILTPDEKLEEYTRDEMDMPRMDKATARLLETPQNAPEAQGEEDVKSGDEEVDDDDDANGQGTSASKQRGATGVNAPGNEPGGRNAQIGKGAPQPTKARVGQPRQSSAPGMTQQAKGTGKKNTGRDNSGG